MTYETEDAARRAVSDALVLLRDNGYFQVANKIEDIANTHGLPISSSSEAVSAQWTPEVWDESLDDLAREIISALSEGDGQHTEELDLRIIKAHVRNYMRQVPSIPPNVAEKV